MSRGGTSSHMFSCLDKPLKWRRVRRYHTLTCVGCRLNGRMCLGFGREERGRPVQTAATAAPARQFPGQMLQSGKTRWTLLLLLGWTTVELTGDSVLHQTAGRLSATEGSQQRAFAMKTSSKTCFLTVAVLSLESQTNANGNVAVWSYSLRCESPAFV